jgi:hypothetical protein
LNHAVQVNALLGYQNRVGMSNRPQHDPNAASDELIYAFFRHFLDPGNLGGTAGARP